MAEVRTIKLQVDAEQAVKQVDELQHGIAATDEAAVGSKHGFAVMRKGITGVSVAFKALGVGLIVSGFVALKEALEKNQVIMDKISVTGAIVGDIFQKLLTPIVEVIKGLGMLGKAVSSVLKGQFKEASEIATNAFDNVKQSIVGNNESFSDFVQSARDAANESIKVAKNLKDMRNEVKLAEAQQRQLQLTFQKEAEIQRQIRDDISLTFEERIAANEELGKVLDRQFEEEQALANKKVALAELELSRNKTNIDLQVALIDAKTELADLDERITGQRSEQLTNLNALQKEYNDSIKETGKEAKKTAETEVQITKLTQEAKVGIISGALGNISTALGENSKAGKALAIGQALIDTYAGANKALAQGGVFGAISAAGIVAAGLANVARIKNTKLDGGVAASPDIPDTQINAVGGIGGLIPNLEAVSPPDLDTVQPVQAYVVETDISDAQALQEELEIQATL